MSGRALDGVASIHDFQIAAPFALTQWTHGDRHTPGFYVQQGRSWTSRRDFRPEWYRMDARIYFTYCFGFWSNLALHPGEQK